MSHVLRDAEPRSGSAGRLLLVLVLALACSGRVATRWEWGTRVRASELGTEAAQTESERADAASRAGEVKPQDTSGAGSTAAGTVAREGTILEHVTGRFRREGDRFLFVSQDQRWNVFVLENLMLERVGQLIGDSQRGLEWQVSGTLMEFQGGNYLLLSRATARPAGVRPRSESADQRTW